MRTFVLQTRFLDREQRLDVLVNNAAVVPNSRETTVDGLELQMGVNHLGPFLFTNLLLDVLKKTAPSRIVNVASTGHYYGNINKEDFQYAKGSYNSFKAYANTKLANVLFTKELAERLVGTEVTANCLHPGVVKTEIARNKKLIIYLLFPFSWLYRTAKAGAQTTIMVSVDPELVKVTGKYFDNCAIKKESSRAQDNDISKWLWTESERLTNLNV